MVFTVNKSTNKGASWTKALVCVLARRKCCSAPLWVIYRVKGGRWPMEDSFHKTCITLRRELNYLSIDIFCLWFCGCGLQCNKPLWPVRPCVTNYLAKMSAVHKFLALSHVHNVV